MVVDHRVDASREGQRRFWRDALTTLPEKASALAIQGFGRFGPLGPPQSDSRRRFDAAQDRGAWLWLPCVLVGLGIACHRGLRQFRRGEPATMWALAAQFAVAMATVGAFLPLAWDRYFLPIQAGSSLLVAVASVAALDALRPRRRSP